MAQILIVEDDESIRELLRRILSMEGYTVSEASTGAEALERLQRGPLDLVLLDVMLGSTSGFDVLEDADRRGLRAKSRVVMLTARNSERDFLHGWRSGVDHYVTKPFDPSALVKVVREILQRSPEELAERRREELEKAELLYRLENAFER